MSGETERPSWQRPPFEPGNTLGATAGNELALKHGAFSSRVIEPLAKAILEDVVATAPKWLEVVDASALDAWATAEARCVALRKYVDEHGMLDSKGNTRNAADLLLRCERLALQLRSRLGFDPLARAALGRDTAIAFAAAGDAVERATTTGAAIRAAREESDGSA